MKTAMHHKRAPGGIDDFSAPVFFGTTLLISAVLAVLTFLAGNLMGIGAFLVHHRASVILACVLTGLLVASAIAERRWNH